MPEVSFNVWAAFLAGFLATVVMSAVMTMAKKMGMTNMPAFPLMTGTMMAGEKSTAKRVGIFVHYIMMGTIVFGLIYVALFTAFDNTSWWVGIVIGVVHGLLVGAIAMPMMPMTHPRMDSAAAFPGGETVAVREGEVRLAAPGLFGKQWGGMTPMGVILGHLIYGLVIALVYNALV